MREQEGTDSADNTTVERVVVDLKDRVERARAAGEYADDLSGVELQKPEQSMPIVRGLDLQGAGPRVRFRPELGFSSKPVIGPVITFVKRTLLRLQLHVFEDLAQQTDAAIARVETAIAVEAATRERLEDRVKALESRLAMLQKSRPGPRSTGG
jgi:hypothetical protein